MDKESMAAAHGEKDWDRVGACGSKLLLLIESDG